MLRLILLLILLQSVSPTWAMCEAMVHQFEHQHGIPKNLLMAMAMVESGREIPGRGVVPWPWTLNAQGKSYSFKTKHEAIMKVKELRRKGIKSIDVGCMQVNLKHHPHAFRDLEEAFDPMANIAYAVSFLREKMEKLGGNWYGAVARYHSMVPRLNLVYKKRVMQAWAKVQVHQNLKKIYARVNEEGEFDTHLESHEGQKMPIRIKFAPYTGLRKSDLPPKPKPAKQRSFFRTKIRKVGNSFSLPKQKLTLPMSPLMR